MSEVKDQAPENQSAMAIGLPLGIALGMGVGLSLGMVFGLLLDNLALGMGVGVAMGPALGLPFAVALGQQQLKKQQEADQDRPDQETSK